MLIKLLLGYEATQCLYVVAKLNVADHLLNTPKSISNLAELTYSNSESLYRVMRCLASLGIFKEHDHRVFSLNEAAKDLLSDSENTMKDFIILCGEELYQSAGELLYSVKTNKPAFEHINGMSHWDYLEANPDKEKLFQSAMEKGTGPMIRKIIFHYDFTPYKNIVDVGGGKGHLLCEILNQYPDSYGAVYDLPNVSELAQEHINKTNVADRCTVLSGSFFDHVPNGDIHLLKVVLHDWDDEHAKLILKNCRKSLPDHGKLLIIEKVIEDNQFKDMTCLSDINMLVMVGGKERSLQEFKQLLNESGFQFLQKITTSTIFSIIEAETI